MLADGTVSLVVEEKRTDFVRCRVVQPGVIRSRQGVNLPGVKLSAPAMSDADREHAAWAADNEHRLRRPELRAQAEDVRAAENRCCAPAAPAPG